MLLITFITASKYILNKLFYKIILISDKIESNKTYFSKYLHFDTNVNALYIHYN